MKAYFTLHIHKVALRLVLFTFLVMHALFLLHLATETHYFIIFWLIGLGLTTFLSAIMLLALAVDLILRFNYLEQHISVMVLVILNLVLMVSFLFYEF